MALSSIPPPPQSLRQDPATLKWILDVITASTQFGAFTDLTDTPGTLTADQFAKGNAGGTELEFTALPAIPDEFTDLTDTPGSITALQILRGDAAGAALEFVTHLRTTKVTTTSHNAGDNNVILCDDDTAGALITITLPAVATALLGTREYHVKKLGTTANVRLDGNGSETIDGALTQDITMQWNSLHVVTDGIEWFIL